tara:strand:+ start:239 stop:1516 length:1278 start_codon:yes stop_codon:yes gene_type:complete
MVNIQKNLYNTYQFNNRGFGLELEFAFGNIADDNITRSERRSIKEEALNLACDLAEQHQDIFKGLRVMYDGSAKVAIEIVFPILFDHQNAWNYISDILSILKENGFSVATDNGMHMHISTHKALETDKAELIQKSINHQASLITRHNDAYGYQTIDFRNDFSAPSDLFQYNTEMEFELVKDVMLRYALGLNHIQKVLPSSRTNNTFCETHKMTESRINSTSSISDLTFGKFTAVNLMTFSNGTIEFRQALTTLNVDKIIVWFRFLDNLIRYSDTRRLTRIAETVYNVPNSLRPYLTRSNTRQELLYNELYNSNNEIGIQTNQLMDMFGLTSQSIRRLISDIHSTFNRNQINSDDFLITHTFRENGSSYGDGITNTSYQIVKQVNRSCSVELLPLNRIGLESIFADLDDDTFAFLHQAKTNRLMRI